MLSVGKQQFLKSCQIIQLPIPIRKKLFNLKVIGRLWRTSEWQIRAPQQYYSQGWKQIFAAIISSKVKKFVLDLNQRPTIIKHIIHINFTDLKQLWLHGNHIQSIEILQFLNAPKLQILSLSANKISSVDSLSKCNFPNLKLLDIQQNPYLKFQKIQRCNLNNLIEFALQWQKKDPVIVEDLRKLAKIRLINKSELRINGRNRIKQTNTILTLQKYYGPCRIVVANR